MKFIHTADIHWGMTPDSEKPWSQERAQAIKETFQEIIRQARDRDVDFLFIAGDLFHRQPLVRDLKEINYLFSTIPSVQVVIIAGNHDRLRANSAVFSFSWCPNVTYLTNTELDSVYFERRNTDGYEFSYNTAEIRADKLGELQDPDNGRILIQIAQGGEANHLAIDPAGLAATTLYFISLGDS